VLPSTRPSGKGHPAIAHRDYEITIQPDAPSFYGEVWDFKPWFWYIQEWLTPWFDDPPLIDRRDITQVPLGAPDVQPVSSVQGDELSNLVIAESQGGQVSIFDIAAPNDPVNIYGQEWGPLVGDWSSSPYYVEGITQAGVEYMERQALERGAAELQQIVDMTPLQEAEAILMQPIGEAEVTDVANFFDNLGDVFLDVARQYIPGINAPAPMGFADPGAAAVQPPLGAAAAPTGAACDTGPSPVYKKVCGVYKWVYPKRRRRRQLLTESDYNGLLRIESLKVNKNMTVAIAKALTR